MFKAYRFRIYPNQAQVREMASHFGCARWVYNWALGKMIAYYEEHQKGLPIRKVQDELVALKKTEEKAWLREVNSQALLASLMDVKKAFVNFFEKRAGFPRFKKKYDSKQSYQCPQHVKVNIQDNCIVLPKIGAVKAKLHRTFQGTIKTTTISRNSSGHYYTSILVETAEALPIPTTVDLEYTLGLDLGINHFLVTSEGAKAENPRNLAKGLKRIKKLQRQLAKKEKCSANRAKARKRLARQHEKVKNKRLAAIHRVSANLVFKNQATSFAIEDLNVKGMLKNRKLSKAISDCGWSEFTRQLQYKSAWMGKNVLIIGRWDPSSKLCSHCGHKKETLSLNQRIYDCTHCGLSIDRDHNAAINIKKIALAQYRDGVAQIQACGPSSGGDVFKEDFLKMSSHHGMKQEAPFIKCA